jgi:hypothetical protein
LPKAEVCRVPAPVPHIVTVFALRGTVSAVERPPGHTVLEAILAAPRPANELGVPAEVLDVTAAAALVSVLLATVKPFASSDSGSQVVMTAEACILVDSFAGGMALAAVGVAINLGVSRRELPRRQELRPTWPRHQRSPNRPGHGDHADDEEGRRAAVHCEKIQR